MRQIGIWTNRKTKVSPGHYGNPEKRTLNDRKINEQIIHTLIKKMGLESDRSGLSLHSAT